MKYSEIINNELAAYRNQMGDFFKRDIGNVMKELDDRFALTKQNCQNGIQNCDKCIQQAQDIMDLSDKLNNAARDCEQLVEAVTLYKTLAEKIDKSFLERQPDFKEMSKSVTKLTQKYSELNDLRQKIAAAMSGTNISESDRKKLINAKDVRKYFEAAKKAKESERANLQAQLDALDPYSTLSEDNKRELTEYASAAKKLSLCFWTGSKNDYTNIKRLVALACMRREDVVLGDNKLSVVCRERFDEINYNCSPEFNLSELAMSRVPLFKTIKIKYVDLSGTKAKIDKNDSNVYMLSEQFIDQALKFIAEDPDINLPSLALRLFDEYFADPSDKFLSHRESLLEFKRLYEETPEEILVTEQRYYSQKMLEEEQEKRAMLQEQYEEERQYQEELENRRRREEARAERARMREEEQRRRDEERERTRQQLAKQQEKRDTHIQCTLCARYNNCPMKNQRPNCAAYIPKK